MVSVLSILGTTLSLIFALQSGPPRTWGTTSQLVIRSTATTFDTRGALTTAWLANLPQALLSLFYFTINRICTSMCFSKEWNSFSSHRKGLRVTSPTAKQRSTHFLQLPYRWAVPLTVTSGFLHWLLSQSLFLVRREARTRDNELYPDSTCACGYSVLSLLIFAIAFLFLVATVGILLRRNVDVQLPPARHCSIVISAACHPPAADVDCHLSAVQWGVVEEGTEDTFGHCTFTSYEVSKPQEGCMYA